MECSQEAPSYYLTPLVLRGEWVDIIIASLVSLLSVAEVGEGVHSWIYEIVPEWWNKA